MTSINLYLIGNLVDESGKDRCPPPLNAKRQERRQSPLAAGIRVQVPARGVVANSQFSTMRVQAESHRRIVVRVDRRDFPDLSPGQPWLSVQATELHLNSRRKARKPVMPMPRRAIEVGSGTARNGYGGVKGAVVAQGNPESPELNDADRKNWSPKVHSRVDVVPADSVKSTVTMLPDSVMEMPDRPPIIVILRSEMGSTDGE